MQSPLATLPSEPRSHDEVCREELICDRARSQIILKNIPRTIRIAGTATEERLNTSTCIHATP
jgi:hypothetical protein